MFGNTLKVENDRLSLILRQLREDEIPHIVPLLNLWDVSKYRGHFGAVTEQTEMEWLEKTAKSDNSWVWSIERKSKRIWDKIGKTKSIAIGNTGLYGFRNGNNSCASGCVIWDKKEWGKGVASLVNIATTWFAVRQLGIYTIHCEVYEPNIGAQKAVERVGYIKTGKVLKSYYVDGKFVHKFQYSWMNPEALDNLYPKGLSYKEIEDLEGIEGIAEGLERAKITLEKGDTYVKYV